MLKLHQLKVAKVKGKKNLPTNSIDKRKADGVAVAGEKKREGREILCKNKIKMVFFFIHREADPIPKSPFGVKTEKNR